MCRSPQSLRLLGSALNEVNVGRDCCLSAQEAIELLARGNYSAVVLDFDLPGAAHVAKLARLAPAPRRPVVFAMLGATTDVGASYQAGANFVLYKPLARDQVVRSFRAARGFMRRDRRRSSRQPVPQTVVYLLFGRHLAIPALLLDLNEDGLSLQAAEPLPPMQEVPIHFLLPGKAHAIDGAAEVVWADDSGRAGLFFSSLASKSQRHLNSWLKRERRKHLAADMVGTTKAKAATAQA